MKKSKLLSLMVLGLSLMLTFIACSEVTGGTLLPSVLDYNKEWSPVESAEDLFGTDVGNLWVAAPIGLATVGYLDELIACEKGISLSKGIYAFEVSASIDDNVFATDVNVFENDMVAELRVVLSDRSRIVASQEIYRRDFLEANVLQTLRLTFALPQNEKVDIEVKYFNKATMKIGVLRIKGIEATEHLRENYSGYFAESENDKTLTLSEDNLYYFDLYTYLLSVRDSVIGYDITNMVATLQGLVNREKQLLFIRFNSPNIYMTNQDEFWLDYLMKDGRLLSGKNLVTVDRPATLLRLFGSYFNGLTVWDETVPATSNVAATVCGVEDRLPVRYSKKINSLYRILTEDYHLEEKVNLTGMFKNRVSGKITGTNIESTLSAKNDAYLWAKSKFLDTGKVNATVMANHLDAFSWDKSGLSMTYYNLQVQLLANKDYYIAKKSFFWDLHVWDDSIPNDDPNQIEGTDFATLDKIMTKQNELANGELIVIGGFIPWWIKYTEKASIELPGDVATEWKWATELGNYYAVKDADAYGFTSLANASIYCQVPQPTGGYTQKTDNSETATAARAAKYLDESDKPKAANYVMAYMGDYDSGAWLTMAMAGNFSDPNRGSLPLAWPINPATAQRVPFIFNYMYENQGSNDFFVGDHNGFGYIELNTLESSSRPSYLNGSVQSYFQTSKQAWNFYDLDMMGFLINTLNKNYSASLETLIGDLAPRGVVCNRTRYGNGMMIPNTAGTSVPWSNHFDFPNGSAVEIGAAFERRFSVPNSPTFIMARSILKTPTFVKECFDRINLSKPEYKITVVDPYVYMYLIAQNNQ